MSDMTEFRPKTGGESALCLSGGGIRSATFCLGALQALAKFGWLRQFNYLSTVSGGGYIGSWLSAWIRLEEIRADRDLELQRRSDCELHEQAVAEVEKALRKSVTQGRTEPEPLRRLRAYSNYLSPVAGVSGDLLTLISIFIRNLALNWMVLFPAFFAIVLLPITIGAVSDILTQLNSNSGPWYLCFAIALACAVIAIAYSYGDLPDKQFHQTKRSFYCGCGCCRWFSGALYSVCPP
jgi:hypothetical protein